MPPATAIDTIITSSAATKRRRCSFCSQPTAGENNKVRVMAKASGMRTSRARYITATTPVRVAAKRIATVLRGWITGRRSPLVPVNVQAVGHREHPGNTPPIPRIKMVGAHKLNVRFMQDSSLLVVACWSPNSPHRPVERQQVMGRDSAIRGCRSGTGTCKRCLIFKARTSNHDANTRNAHSRRKGPLRALHTAGSNYFSRFQDRFRVVSAQMCDAGTADVTYWNRGGHDNTKELTNMRKIDHFPAFFAGIRIGVSEAGVFAPESG